MPSRKKSEESFLEEKEKKTPDRPQTWARRSAWGRVCANKKQKNKKGKKNKKKRV